MGYILTATCESCGLNEKLFVAWGFSAVVPGKNRPTYDMEVAACFNCGILTVADRVGKKDNCPKCRRRLVLYKTNRFFSTAPSSLYSRYVGVLTLDAEKRKMLHENYPEQEEKMNSETVRYLCPVCGEKKLVFEDWGGMWD